MEERSALIAYATETGNAFDFAEEIGRLLERIHFSTHVCQLDSLDPVGISKVGYFILLAKAGI